MKVPFSFSLRQIAWAAFANAVILLLAISFVAYRATNLLVSSEKGVARTREVQRLMESVCTNSLSANNGRRGYILTGDPGMLRNYQNAVQQSPKILGQLREMSVDNPGRLREINQLESLLRQHLELLQSSIDLRKQGGADGERQIEITRQDAMRAANIRSLVSTMQNDENALLTQRQEAAERSYRRTIGSLAAAFLLALGLLVAQFWSLKLEFSKRERSERVARQSRELVNGFFASSTVGFGILDSDLRYQRINDVLAHMGGVEPDQLLGKTLPEVFQRSAPQAETVLRHVLSSGLPVLDREISGPLLNKENEIRHWLVNYFPIRDAEDKIHEVGVIALDITARRRAEQMIRRLSGRLLNLQDQERRRIARELHDSLGQYLVGLKITIEMLANPAATDKADLLRQCSEILDRCISEARTLSHLLHPPLLDEAGFASAAKWFVEGFSQRSGIPVKLELPENPSRLPSPVEIALFRVLQEGLTNVHRHSRSPSAEIRVELDAENVTLEIKDHGCGVPKAVLEPTSENGRHSGVGLSGMQERAFELGGTFEIESDVKGTKLMLKLPLAGYPEESSRSVS